jgi:uncharacterized membrane protein YkvA (DUF1232 family)
MHDKKENDAMNSERAVSLKNKEPGFWRDIWQQIRLVYYLVKDPDVPIYLKVLPFVGLIYVVIPFDFVTDFLPFLGQLDDITAVLATSKIFIELAPQDVVIKHMNRIREADGFAAADEKVVDSIIIEPDELENSDTENAS